MPKMFAEPMLTRSICIMNHRATIGGRRWISSFQMNLRYWRGVRGWMVLLTKDGSTSSMTFSSMLTGWVLDTESVILTEDLVS